MRTGRIAAIAALAAGLLAGGASLPTTADRREAAAGSAATPLDPHRPPADLPALQARLEDVPGDWRTWAALGLASVQRARTDPGFYPRAEGALRRSLALRPGNLDALVGMSALAAGRHDFDDALRWARRARRTAPRSAPALGVAADALIELGRYDEAFETLQRMVDLRPDLSSYARAAYARELQGDHAGALGAMEMALGAASSPPDSAWASFQIGELHFNDGELARAAAAYRRAAWFDPTFVPARAGLAKVDAARGRFERAIEGYRRVVERMPVPEYVIELGEAYAAAGRRARAAEQEALLRAQQRLARANGANVDLEVALFDADHGNPRRALRAARAEWARRHSIHAADALAWALHANGRDRDARTYSRRALALGTRSAPFWFHRGMIERALGNEDAARRALARALAINPSFSIRWSDRAADVLASLGGAL